MKTNRFNESIRRKLDSLEPTYQETAWKRMQQSMHQHGVPSYWPSASQWLLPTVGALTIVGLLVTTVWQYRTTQQLHETVQTLNHTVKGLKDSVQSAGLNPPSRVDTVYVVQRIGAGSERYASRPNNTHSTPVEPNLNRSEPYGSNETHSSRDDQAVANGTAPTEAGRPVEPSRESRVAADGPNRMATDGREVSDPAPIGNEAIGTTTNRANSVLTEEATATRPSIYSPSNARRLTARGNGRRSGRIRNNQSVSAVERSNDNPFSTPIQLGSEASALRLNVQPLPTASAQFDNTYLLQGYNRRMRRIRSAMPASIRAVASSAAPKAPAVERDEPNVRVRVGLSGSLAFKQLAGGAYGEVIFGRHLTVGVGVNRVVESGGKYVTDDQFNQRNHGDFRQEYAPRLDPHYEIFNIARQNYCWKLPVSLGYRITMGSGVALIPSVGLNVNVNSSSREKIAFAYRRGPAEWKPIEYWVPRPASRLSDGSVAFMAEKQWFNHLVVQAGPYASIPLHPSPGGFNSLTAGIRARLLYQF